MGFVEHPRTGTRMLDSLLEEADCSRLPLLDEGELRTIRADEVSSSKAPRLPADTVEARHPGGP